MYIIICLLISVPLCIGFEFVYSSYFPRPSSILSASHSFFLSFSYFTFMYLLLSPTHKVFHLSPSTSVSRYIHQVQCCWLPLLCLPEWSEQRKRYQDGITAKEPVSLLTRSFVSIFSFPLSVESLWTPNTEERKKKNDSVHHNTSPCFIFICLHCTSNYLPANVCLSCQLPLNAC